MIGVDRMYPGAVHQDDGRMAQRLFKGCHSIAETQYRIKSERQYHG
jgi:hypothetical protein